MPAGEHVRRYGWKQACWIQRGHESSPAGRGLYPAITVWAGPRAARGPGRLVLRQQHRQRAGIALQQHRELPGRPGGRRLDPIADFLPRHAGLRPQRKSLRRRPGVECHLSIQSRCDGPTVPRRGQRFRWVCAGRIHVCRRRHERPYRRRFGRPISGCAFTTATRRRSSHRAAASSCCDLGLEQRQPPDCGFGFGR